ILTKLFYLYLILLCSLTVLQVSISLNKVELSVGESKFFKCTVIGEPVNLEWFNPQGERIVSSQRVALHTGEDSSRLTIYNAEVEDAGIYRCQATDTQGQTQEATMVLEMYQKLTFRGVRSPQEFRHDEAAEVVCDVIASPAPAVSWFYQKGFKSMEITEEHYSRFQVLPNNNLQIHKVTKADEGVYRCEARVEARGEIDFVDIEVVVNAYMLCVLYELIISTCTVSVHRKGQQLERSEKYVLNTMEAGRCTLTIHNIIQGDWGDYTCRATNKAGAEERELFLKVFVQPHIIQLRNVTAVEGSAAMISCVAEGEPLPEISWRRASDGQSFADGDKSQDGRVDVRGRHGKSMLTISGVKLTDLGRFDCEALSRIGGHQKSMFLDIEYMPKFQTNQTIFYSWEGNPVNISCDVKSNPPATVLWRRERLTISVEGTANTRIHTTDGKSLLEVTPVSDRDFGRYNCTARNNIGVKYQEFILAQAGKSIVLLTGLEPNTTYEVRVAAVNGKGQGEFSHTESFQTLPIREPSPPAVHGQRGMGKAYRLGLVKQDDGGMPIVEYIVKYKTDKEEQWMTKLVSGQHDFALLQPLQWNTRYEVEITARNVKGLSEPTFYQFFMPQKPDIIADSLFSGLGLGPVVGLGLVGFLLVLVVVDVSCYFLRQCGLLMYITRKLCSKKTATSGKSKEMEEGKAAYLKLPLKEENGKETLKPDMIEIKVHSDNSIHTKQDDSKA
uniref:Neural cell adhesion molecule 2 n=1 Tax=Hucho hucho TaxID=62062 RepID=A0A4W5QHH9_9TELE